MVCLSRPATSLKKETLVQVFSSEFCKIFKSTFCTEHLRTTASEINKLINQIAKLINELLLEESNGLTSFLRK